MKRTLALLSVLAIASLCGGCSETPANNNNAAPQTGLVETNANVNKNLNANTAPSNVGVVTNDNGNKNTSGIRPINDNANSNQNNNRKTGNRNN